MKCFSFNTNSALRNKMHSVWRDYSSGCDDTRIYTERVHLRCWPTLVMAILRDKNTGWTYSCPRDWRISATWGTNWWPLWNPRTITALSYRGVWGEPSYKPPLYRETPVSQTANEIFPVWRRFAARWEINFRFLFKLMWLCLQFLNVFGANKTHFRYVLIQTDDWKCRLIPLHVKSEIDFLLGNNTGLHTENSISNLVFATEYGL